LGVCGTGTTTTTSFALCGYLLSSITPITPISGAVSTPGTFGSASTVPVSISATNAVSGDTQISFSVTTNQAETNGFNICYVSSTTGTVDPTPLVALVGTTADCTGTGLTEVSIS